MLTLPLLNILCYLSTYLLRKDIYKYAYNILSLVCIKTYPQYMKMYADSINVPHMLLATFSNGSSLLSIFLPAKNWQKSLPPPSFGQIISSESLSCKTQTMLFNLVHRPWASCTLRLNSDRTLPIQCHSQSPVPLLDLVDSP